MDLEALSHCQGVVILTHFCEQHGPSTLLSTVKLSVDRRKDVLEEEESGGDSKTHRMSKTFFSLDGKGSVNGGGAPCNGCKSLEAGDEGFVSFNTAKHFCATTKFPEAHLYSCVRHVCVRSLSMELVPGREGPVIFGQEDKGLVLSFPFIISDSQARGFARTMSLCFLHSDARALLAATRFISASFAAIAGQLKKDSAQLCEREQQMQGGSGNSISIRRVNHLHASAPVRTLAELVGFEDNASNLYERLHASFCNVLFQFEESLPVAQVSTDGKLSLHQVWPALGAQRFAELLCELCLGRRVEIRYDSGQSVLAEKLWDSMRFISPNPDECVLLHAEDDEVVVEGVKSTRRPLRLLVCEGMPAKIQSELGQISQPVLGLLMRQVYSVIEQKLALKMERSLIQAMLFEFGAIAAILSQGEPTRKAYSVYDMDPTLDEVFVKAWVKYKPNSN